MVLKKFIAYIELEILEDIGEDFIKFYIKDTLENSGIGQETNLRCIAVPINEEELYD